ncbi:MAG: RagB/SusD family nutrient uptake outer membrane protein [Marinilabiliales bacterium]|nr:MAG: RagB/SusD family nutrient uptake outer membrane protein [Marinilabiliales bacterium]
MNALYDYLSVGTDYLWDPGFGGIFFNDYWVLQDLLSDNCFETLSSPEYRNISEFRFTPDNQRFELYWQDLYKTINAANVVIAKVPNIEFNEQHRLHLESEARFVRAMMYFELVKYFGEVPLTITPTESADEAFISRTNLDDVYNVIISDLEFAESNLSNNYRVGDGRPVPFAATALLGKVFLTKGDYDNAAEKLYDVIESGKFYLWPDYADIFKISNMNSGEIIFAVNFSGTLSEGFKPNQYHVRLLPSGLDVDGEGPENAHGLELPTDNLFNSFNPLDRRRSVTFITSYTYSDGTTINFEPHIGKFWDQEAEPRGNNTNSDVIYLRYADVLLMYAEALNETNNGPTTEAYNAINEVRKRARYNGVVEQNILPDLSGLSYSEFCDAILNERRLEFVMEGSRYNDLRRFGKLVEAVEASGKENINPQDFHYLLPIPQRERDLNTKLTQNTGY